MINGHCQVYVNFSECLTWNNSSVKMIYSILRVWILEFEMSVHRICEFDPFWTDPKIKCQFLFFLKMWQLFILTFVQPLRRFFLQKDTHSLTQTDRQRRSNSSLDVGTYKGLSINYVSRFLPIFDELCTLVLISFTKIWAEF